MSMQESFAMHAKERERAIAECDASPACRAELRRRDAINVCYDCENRNKRAREESLGAYTATCVKPW